MAFYANILVILHFFLRNVLEYLRKENTQGSQRLIIVTHSFVNK